MASFIVAHSNLLKNELENYYSNIKDKVKVFYPITKYRKGNSSDIFISNLKKRFNIASDKILFLFVSSSHERKGFFLLKQIFESSQLPVLLGVCGKPLPSKNTKNIIYLGFHKDLRPFYQMADYTILASSYEPFGLAPIESLFCGTPVVVPRNLGCCEIIKEKAKIEFNSKDLLSLASAIEHAVQQFPKMKDITKHSKNNLKIDTENYNQIGFYIHLINKIKR